MKEKIYTIPVIDGFKEKTECPFCKIYKTLDDDATSYMLGSSYMEDDIRMDTNEQGFCQNHYQKMYKNQNRLGLALMTYDHLLNINKKITNLTKKTSVGVKPKFNFLNKNKAKNKSGIQLLLKKIHNSCYICNRINKTFDRYVDTFFVLWKQNKEIVEYVKQGSVTRS